MTQIKMKTAAVLLMLLTAGCKGLPEAYQGTFHDRENGVRLTLSSSSALIEMRGGKKIEEEGQEISYENLLRGVGGLYVQSGNNAGGIADVYYVKPQKGTRQSEADLVWYKAELIYTQMDTNRNAPVRELQLIRCANGTITVDTVSKRWQLGCPAGAAKYNLKRTKDREVFNPFNL